MSPDSPAAGPRPPVVDVHWHHVPRVLVDRIANGTCVFDGEYRRDGADEMLAPAGGLSVHLVDTLADPWCARAHLNAAGIDVGLASLAPPLIQYEAPPAQALHYSRLVNDAFADIQSAHAGRILALANVPLQDPVAAAAEARRAVHELQLTGIALGSSVGEHSLGDAVLEPFWEALGELDTFVFVHGIQSPTWRKRVRSAEVLGSFVGLPVDLALSVASLIFGGGLERHPGLKICFPMGVGPSPICSGGGSTDGKRVRAPAVISLFRRVSRWPASTATPWSTTSRPCDSLSMRWGSITSCWAAISLSTWGRRIRSPRSVTSSGAGTFRTGSAEDRRPPCSLGRCADDQ